MPWGITPWRPTGELGRIRREMDRLWDSFFERGLPERFESREWMPAFDMAEKENELIVKVDLPGIEPKELDVSVSDNTLTVRGEKKEEREEKKEDYLMRESAYGAFSRSVRLPYPIQSDKIKTSYQDGVLRIAMPKSEEAKKKQVKVAVQ
jgi:HSP20 family protein